VRSGPRTCVGSACCRGDLSGVSPVTLVSDMKALTAAEMRDVDRLTTDRYKITGTQLMESAGKHVADAVLRLGGAGSDGRIVVLCGKGNNGADGLVCARYLKNAGHDPQVWFFGGEPNAGSDAGDNFQRWKQVSERTTFIEDVAAWERMRPGIGGAQIIVDALLGTGLRGAAEGLVAAAIEEVNRVSKNATAANPGLILAVDTPSGLPSDGQAGAGPVLCAHRTVTFTAPKIGQLESADAAKAGALEVVQIGSPRSLVEEIGRGPMRWAEPQEFAQIPLVRPWDSNKGVYGNALLVAGSTGKSGAAILCCSAALRGGAGLVTIATSAPVLPMVAAAHPEYMTEPLEATKDGTVAIANWTSQSFAKLLEKRSVLGMGPGLGTEPETQEFIREVVQNAELPIVLDADGLNAFASRADALAERKSKFLAITPHPGEMGRLAWKSTKDVQATRIKTALEAARRWNAHVILKGFHTIVASPEGALFVNTSGNPGLSKGGSGDVLTGFLTALTSQFGTSDWLRVLALGVYLHGKAAEIATAHTDISGLLSSELVNALPLARRALLEELRQSA
jgi:ADP-dependent NAD(P)H-hydrate dehydratase / NAD(P)H-hydrate epimerase